MKTQLIPDQLAYSLGEEAYQQTLERAKDLCAWEKQRIGKQNESDATAVRARLACLNEERERLRQLLRQNPSGTASNSSRLLGGYSLVGLVLWLAGVFFAHLALEPFGLGLAAWVYSLAIGLAVPVLVDLALIHFDSRWLIRTACLIGLGASLTGLFILALLRGDVVLLYLQTALAGSMPSEPTVDSAASFYRETADYLKWLFALLTVGMELAAGLCLHEVRKLATGSQAEANRAAKLLAAVEEEMTSLVGELTRLENEAEVFEAGFMRDFHHGLLDRIERNGRNGFFASALLAVFLLSPVPADAQMWMKLPWTKASAPPVSYHVIIGIDLSQSVAGSGYDGTTQYQKNMEALGRFAVDLPAGAQLTVAAITDHSFAKSYILLDRRLPQDPGPLRFLDQIEIHKNKIAAQLKRLSTSIEPEFPETDVLGFVTLAAQIFKQSSSDRKVLLFFSDMRHSAPVVNLERRHQINTSEALQIVERHQLCADLTGIDVYVYGAHGNKKSVAYWESLHAFWKEYFEQNGARLKTYSTTRDIAIPFKTHETEMAE